MEYSTQNLNSLEEKITESNLKIEMLSALIQNKFSKEGTEPSELTILVSELRKYLDEKQNALSSKLTSIEEINHLVADLIKKKYSEAQEQNNNTELIRKNLSFLEDQVACLLNTLDQYKDSLNNISNVNNIDPLKDEIKDFEKTIANQLVQIFDNISFIEEAEDIKSFIESSDEVLKRKLEELKDSLVNIDKKIGEIKETSAGIDSDRISSLDNNFSKEIEFIKSDIFNVQNKITQLSSEINDNFTFAENKNKEVLNSLTEEIKASYEKLSEEIGELSRSLNSAINTLSLENTAEKSSWDNKIEDLKTSISSELNKLGSIHELIANNDINSIKEPLNSKGFSDKFDDFLEKLDSISDQISLIKNNIQDEDFSKKINDFYKNFEIIKSNIFERFSSLSDSICSANNKKADEIKAFINEELSSLDYSLNSFLGKVIEEVSPEKLDLDNRFNDLKANICLEDIRESINEKIKNLDNSINSINLSFNIDELAERLNFDEKIEEIKNTISHELTVEKLVVDKNIGEIQSIILDGLKNIEMISESLYKTGVSAEDQVEAMRDIFNHLKTEMESLLGQISSLRDAMSLINSNSDKVLTISKNDSKFLKESIEQINEILEDSKAEIKDKLGSIKNIVDSRLEVSNLELRNKVQEMIDGNISTQESLQKTFANMIYTISDSTNVSQKGINEITHHLNKLSKLSAGSLDNTETVKNYVEELSKWSNEAGNLLKEIDENIKNIKKQASITGDDPDFEDISLSSAGAEKNISLLVKSFNELSAKIDKILKGTGPTGNSAVSDELLNISDTLKEFEDRINDNFEKFSRDLSKKLASRKLDIVEPVQASGDNGFSLDDIDDSLDRLKGAINAEINKMGEKFTGIEKQLGKIEFGLEKFVSLDKQLDEIEFKINKAVKTPGINPDLLRDIDEKINSIQVKQAKSLDNEEIRPILEFIASQVSIVNECNLTNKAILKKMEVIEMRMEALDKNQREFDRNLKEVASYLDE